MLDKLVSCSKLIIWGEGVKKIVLLCLVVGLAGCSNKQKEYSACVAKGIQYYKDIDAYPNLKSENISAESKARKLCSNSVVAFD